MLVPWCSGGARYHLAGVSRLAKPFMRLPGGSPDLLGQTYDIDAAGLMAGPEHGEIDRSDPRALEVDQFRRSHRRRGLFHPPNHWTRSGDCRLWRLQMNAIACQRYWWW